MDRTLTVLITFALILARGLAATPQGDASVPKPRRLNNLVAVLAEVVPAPTAESVAFDHTSDGWIFISLTTQGEGDLRLVLDKTSPGESSLHFAPRGGGVHEAMHHITKPYPCS